MSEPTKDAKSKAEAHFMIIEKIGQEKWKVFARDSQKMPENEIDRILNEAEGRKVIEDWKAYEKSQTVSSASTEKVTLPSEEKPTTFKELESFCSETRTSIASDGLFSFRKQNKAKDCYQIRDKGNRGIVLIMTNVFGEVKNEDGKELVRNGALYDSKKMEKLWNDLKCKVIPTKYDCSASDMMKHLEELSKTDKGAYDYLVVVISTHGGLYKGDAKYVYDEGNKMKFVGKKLQEKECYQENEEVFYGYDMEPVRVRDALELFHNEKAKHLAGIPKMFIFQFCQGRQHDKGVVPDASPERHKGRNVDSSNISRIPAISDMLVAYPAHRGYAAWRREDEGSWFICKIEEIFSRYWKKEHVVDMLTRVNGIMKEAVGHYERWNKDVLEDVYDVKSMSKFESSLTKKFFLFPQ